MKGRGRWWCWGVFEDGSLACEAWFLLLRAPEGRLVSGTVRGIGGADGVNSPFPIASLRTSWVLVVVGCVE